MDENDEHDEERRHTPLSDEQLEKIAVRAADLVMEKVALRIGQGVLKMMFYLIAAAGVAFWTWITAQEHLFK